MLDIVPMDKVGIPGSGMVNRSKELWIANSIFERLMPRLYKRIVIAASSSGITSADEQ